MSHMPLNVISNFSGHPTVANHHELVLRRPTLIPSSLFPDNPSPRVKNQTSLSTINHTVATNLVLLKSSSNVVRALSSPPPATTTTLELEKKRFRKWNPMDFTNMCMIGSTHALGVCAPFVFDWDAVMVSVVLAFMSGFGVTLGYHRLLTHHSFKVPKWLEYFFAYCGVHALQRDPIFWVSIHKYHHQYVDTERDPHTPSQGFWFSHIGWLFDNDYLATKCGESKSGEYSNVDELKKQPFYMFLHDTYLWHPIALAALLYLCGGFPYLAWGMGMRLVVVYHVTFIVANVCHLWGERPWNTPDTSTNNRWIAILTLGESWHNNHHAFPRSARHGLAWWQLDMTWGMINFLQVVKLATDVKLPTEAEKRKIILSSSKTTNGKRPCHMT